ncbi:MAG: sulfite exporter TauE/SafE family protein [Candidatus Eremiobacteraeota bacterium]|nr:sulfite exporter TauE/SafE family protein [Candidatus Eremiobacteraeota bacterium]
MNASLIIAGLSIGTLVGLTGVGGGSLMTPLLVYMGLDPMVAIGTDLLYSLPTKLFGWFLHSKQRSVRLDIVKPLCIGGIPAALVGLGLLSIASRYIDIKILETWMRHAIGVSVVLSALMIIVSPFILRRNRTAGTAAPPLNNARLTMIGAIVGFMVSITSIGSGAVALPLLVLCLPGIGLAELVGTDIAFAVILVFVSVIGHLKMGHVNTAVTVQLLMGSLVGVFLGTKLCRVLAQQWLRPALALVLVVAGSRLI